MSNKNKNKDGIVYSTDNNLTLSDFFSSFKVEPNAEEAITKQQLKVFLDRKGGGKMVSRVTGFVGDNDALNNMAKELKKLCGVGGSAKDGEVLIQGDHRDKIVTFLSKQGHLVKKAGG